MKGDGKGRHSDVAVAHLFVDSFNPFHIRNRILSVKPVLRIAAPHFVNERLKLITVSTQTRAYTKATSSESGSLTRYTKILT